MGKQPGGRPYAVCATESPSGYFEAFVGADIIRPPTLQIFEQKQIGQIGFPMLPIYHVSTLYRRISPYNVRYCIVGALHRRCFPMGKTTGRMLSVMSLSDRPRRSFYFDSLWVAPPYMDVPHCTWCVFCGWLKLINYSIDCVHCQSVWFMEHFIACCFIFFLTGQTHLVTIEL